MNDTDLAKQPDNTPVKVRFRQDVLRAQGEMAQMIEAGVLEDRAGACTLKHHFSPVDKKYGCCAYAREIFLPKGTVVIGKIHKHQHLNFIMQGKVTVKTEFGEKHFTAPCIFVSEVGLKRAVYAEEDTIWVTVHLTEHVGEENLDKIEDEVIAKTYEEMGMIASVQDLSQVGGRE